MSVSPATLNAGSMLVQDWYKDTQTQKQVRSAVEQVLDSNLPESYDRVLFREKCDNVFYLMLDYASHGRKWAAGWWDSVAGSISVQALLSKQKRHREGVVFVCWWGATPYQFDSLQRALATKGGCVNLQEPLVCAASYQEFPWLFYRR